MLTPHWGNATDERVFAVRRLAGALTRGAAVSVIQVSDEPLVGSPVSRRAYEAEQVLPLAGRPLARAALAARLRSTLGSGQISESAADELSTLTLGASDELREAIAATTPDTVVIGGGAPAPIGGWRTAAAGARRIVVWPLLGAGARQTYAPSRRSLDQVDVVCTMTDAERGRIETLLGSAPGPAIETVPIGLPVDRAMAAQRLRGMSDIGGYVLLLRGLADAGAAEASAPDFARLKEQVPGASLVDISPAGWRFIAEGRDELIDAPPSRPNLWRLMFHGLATVELRAGGLLAREAIESLLLGRPVVARASSNAARVVEESGGAVVFSAETELAAALRMLGDPTTRARLGGTGQAWAERRYGDVEQFTSQVLSAVLGRDAA